MTTAAVEVCTCGGLHTGPCPPYPPGLAKHIHVERRGRRVTITVDGEPLPTFTAPDGWALRVEKDSLPGVTVTLLAERVTVADEPLHTLKEN